MSKKQQIEQTLVSHGLQIEESWEDSESETQTFVLLDRGINPFLYFYDTEGKSIAAKIESENVGNTFVGQTPTITIPLELVKTEDDLETLGNYLKSGIYRMCMSPGEIADRLSIIQIKKEQFNSSETQKFLRIEEFHLNLAKYSVARLKEFTGLTVLNEGIRELTEINKQQWLFEEQVRNEPETGVAAANARKCNTERSLAKDAINEHFGYPTDPKDYTTS